MNGLRTSKAVGTGSPSDRHRPWLRLWLRKGVRVGDGVGGGGVTYAMQLVCRLQIAHPSVHVHRRTLHVRDRASCTSAVAPTKTMEPNETEQTSNEMGTARCKD